MIYSVDILTPAKRLKSNPLKTVLKVTKGLVYRVEVERPRGGTRLVGCAIFDGGFQAWPSSSGQWFVGAPLNVGFDDTYLKMIQPFRFDIYSYNEDDTYAHRLFVRIGMASKEVFMARYLPSYSWKYFIEMLDKLKEEERAAQAEVVKNPFPWLRR